MLFFLCISSQTYLKFVEQLLQRHLLFRNTLQERLTAEHWKSLVGDILVQLIGQNDVRRCFHDLNFLWFQSIKPKHWGNRVLMFILIWPVQTAFSDMYLGYTTTLASFLSLEFSRLNHPEKGHKLQVHEAAQHRPSLEAADMLMRSFLLWFFAERPDGERGNEAALLAVGARLSYTQLPESHPGESAAAARTENRADIWKT